MQLLNVLVADDHPIFVEGLNAVLSKSSGKFSCSINGVARSANQVVEMMQKYQPDLVLLDLGLPDTDGMKVIPNLKKGSSKTRVLVMSTFDDPRLVRAAFKAGADGYMLKSGTKDELFWAIEEVINGHTFLGNGVALIDMRMAQNADTAQPDKRFARKHGLTRREMEIMRYIGQALKNKDIAEKLYISDQTVSVHRKNIMRKLQVNNTASLIKIAFENNLV
ncbi:MAG: response regulator transcription factor [Bacteroidetes bacterium]|nr:response regulator transcription factor [Bacteroidota bacterium]